MATNDSAGSTDRLLDELRGGNWGLQQDRDAAEKVTGVWPKGRVREALRWHDRFRSAVAEEAVSRGITAVVFGAPGFPHGDPPHLAAAGVSPQARFWYCDPDPVVTGQRALEGWGRARAVPASVRDPHGLLEAVGLIDAEGRWLGGGPCQVQWGLAAMVMDSGEAARAAAAYGKLLPPGSELVIAIPDGLGGMALAWAGGGYPHVPGDVRAWCGAAGLALDRPVADVRAWGRPDMFGGLREGAGKGRIVVAVARVP